MCVIVVSFFTLILTQELLRAIWFPVSADLLVNENDNMNRSSYDLSHMHTVRESKAEETKTRSKKYCSLMLVCGGCSIPT